nr:DUF2971 domain-containing protein [uncultured Tolumonas sp.]
MSILYHYTGLDGLIGILTGKSIWASHCEYLNDSSEFIHALNFARGISSNIFMDDDYLESFGWLLSDAVHKIDKTNVYVASFSEKADLLSQWRGYCPSGAGVSIGFNKELLDKYCNQHGLRLEKCIYDINTQTSMIHELTNNCYMNFPTPIISREEFNSFSAEQQCEFEYAERLRVTEGDGKAQAEIALTQLCENLNEAAPLIKHSGFHEESEWRIISTESPHKVSFRSSKSHLIPYISLSIIQEYPNILECIYVGPNPSSIRCEKSIEQILINEGYNQVEIKQSHIPFNSW